MSQHWTEPELDRSVRIRTYNVSHRQKSARFRLILNSEVSGLCYQSKNKPDWSDQILTLCNWTHKHWVKLPVCNSLCDRRHLPAAFWVLWCNHQHLCAQSFHFTCLCKRSVANYNIRPFFPEATSRVCTGGHLPTRLACCFSRNPRPIWQEERWGTLNDSLRFSLISSGIHIVTYFDVSASCF